MKTFRYFLDIDAKDKDDAQEQLEEMAGGMSFGDLDCKELEIESWQKKDKITLEELAKFLKIKDPEKMELSDIQSHYSEYDAWLCQHCREDVGNDQRDMIRHLLTHTLEELLRDDDGELIEEDEE